MTVQFLEYCYAIVARSIALLIAVLMLLVALLLVSPPTRAGAIAVTSATKTSDIKDGTDTLWVRGNGVNCVNVVAGTSSNPNAGTGNALASCTEFVGLDFVSGRGRDTKKDPKVDKDTYSDVATHPTTGAKAEAKAVWFFNSGSIHIPPSLFDAVIYDAEASIQAAGLTAESVSDDPTFFDVFVELDIDILVTLDALTVDHSDGVDSIARTAVDYVLDGLELFALSIVVPSDFVSEDDIDIVFRSFLGTAFDVMQENALRAALTVNDSARTVSLGTPFTLLDESILVGVGSHRYESGVLAGIVGVSEPSSLMLLVLGIAGVAWLRHRPCELGSLTRIKI